MNNNGPRSRNRFDSSAFEYQDFESAFMSKPSSGNTSPPSPIFGSVSRPASRMGSRSLMRGEEAKENQPVRKRGSKEVLEIMADQQKDIVRTRPLPAALTQARGSGIGLTRRDS